MLDFGRKRPRVCSLCNENGVSLVEIILVVAIIAIMSFFVAPEIGDYRKNTRLKNTARDIYASVQLVKMESSKRNECAGVLFTTVAYPATGGTYTVFIDNGAGAGGTACDGIRDAGEPVLSSNPVEQGVSLISANNIGSAGGVGGVVVKPNGIVRNNASGSIQLRTDDRYYKITVSPAGGARLEISNNGSTWRN